MVDVTTASADSEQISPVVLSTEPETALTPEDTPPLHVDWSAQTQAAAVSVSEEGPPILVPNAPKQMLAKLDRILVVLVTVLLLAGGMAYVNHLGPFKSHSAAPAHRSLGQVPAPPPCNASTIVTQLTDTAAAPTAAEFAHTQHTYTNAPAMRIDMKKHYCVGLNTNRGLIVLELDPSIAPNTVNNFVYLAQQHFYDGIKFHRVIPRFIIQTGDPTGTGTGGPGYTFNDEPVKGEYTKGCVAMATSGPNMNGSQFFICTANDSFVRKDYTLFGHVVQGMDVMQKIQGPGDDAGSKNIEPDRLNHVTVVAVHTDPGTPAVNTNPNATATANTNPRPTTTAVTNTCFLDPSGPSVPAVYEGSATPTAGPTTAPSMKGTPVNVKDGLRYVDIKAGSGPAATSGNTITVNYTGWLASTCQKIDSSYDPHSGRPAQPFTTQIGQGRVIKGWDEGVVGMQAGGIRRLFIPAALAYGARGAGSTIPPNADLIFDVQLVSIK